MCIFSSSDLYVNSCPVSNKSRKKKPVTFNLLPCSTFWLMIICFGLCVWACACVFLPSSSYSNQNFVYLFCCFDGMISVEGMTDFGPESVWFVFVMFQSPHSFIFEQAENILSNYLSLNTIELWFTRFNVSTGFICIRSQTLCVCVCARRATVIQMIEYGENWISSNIQIDFILKFNYCNRWRYDFIQRLINWKIFSLRSHLRHFGQCVDLVFSHWASVRQRMCMNVRPCVCARAQIDTFHTNACIRKAIEMEKNI